MTRRLIQTLCWLVLGALWTMPAGAQTAAGSADLRLTANASPDPAVKGGMLTLRVEVANNGPDAAVSPVVTLFMPGFRDIAQAGYPIDASDYIDDAATAAGWTCQLLPSPPVWPSMPGWLDCRAQSLAAGASVAISSRIRVRANVIGPLEWRATAGSDTPDPDPANNDSGTLLTAAVSPPALSIPWTSAPALALLALWLLVLGRVALARRAG